MSDAIKRWVYRCAKYLGLFALARRVTRDGLRILCYHSLSLGDGHLWRPKLFMRSETVRRRLAYLRRKVYPVLSLDEALSRLQDGSLPPCATVLTFDDGFYSHFERGIDLYNDFQMPTTHYITTYYAEKESPIFRLVVQYMMWKSQTERIDLNGQRMMSTSDLINYGEEELSEPERVDLCRTIGERLGVDYAALAESRELTLMNAEQLMQAANSGLDLQLHTHRHRFPLKEDEALNELEDNRRVLEKISGHRCHHFCYPSGEWSEAHWPWLEANGVKSATTCDKGLNYRSTPVYALRRFLDGENISAIEFEAEMSGFAELLRKMIGR